MDNPFMLALNKISNLRDGAAKIKNLPAYNDNERVLSKIQRIHLVEKLRDLFLPFTYHEQLLKSMLLLISDGYATRNRFSRSYIEKLRQDNPLALNCHSNLRMLLLGQDGIGKRQSVERLLKSNVNQVITHRIIGRNNLVMDQIVWLKIGIPFDGSVSTFVAQVLFEIDNLLGTTYGKWIKQRGTEGLVSISKVLFLHGVGVLIVEDIEYALDNLTEKTKIISFLKKLSQNTGIPVILIGNEILEGQLKWSCSRKLIWSQMIFDLEWYSFVSTILEYQWTPRKAIVNDIANELYLNSNGNLDQAIKLYISAQQMAISRDRLYITPDTIRDASQLYIL